MPPIYAEKALWISVRISSLIDSYAILEYYTDALFSISACYGNLLLWIPAYGVTTVTDFQQCHRQLPRCLINMLKHCQQVLVDIITAPPNSIRSSIVKWRVCKLRRCLLYLALQVLPKQHGSDSWSDFTSWPRTTQICRRFAWIQSSLGQSTRLSNFSGWHIWNNH